MADKNDKLTASDRNAFKNFVGQRKDSLLKTILDEMGDKSDDQLHWLRMQAGLVVTPDQLEEQLNELERNLNEKVCEHVRKANNKLGVERAELCESYDKQLRDLREKYNKERADLESARDRAISDHDIRKDQVEDEIRKNEYPEESSQIDELKKKIESAKKIDQEIKVKLKNRNILIRNYRSRVESAVREACNNAIERLWTVETREEAKEIVGRAHVRTPVTSQSRMPSSA
jgi:molecular chaperone GrpE (heat shock protein)